MVGTRTSLSSSSSHATSAASSSSSSDIGGQGPRRDGAALSARARPELTDASPPTALRQCSQTPSRGTDRRALCL